MCNMRRKLTVFYLFLVTAALSTSTFASCITPENPLKIDINGEQEGWQPWLIDRNWNGEPVSKTFDMNCLPFERPTAVLSAHTYYVDTIVGSRNRSVGFAFVGHSDGTAVGFGMDYLKLRLLDLEPSTEYMFSIWSFEINNIWGVDPNNPNSKFGVWSTTNPRSWLEANGYPNGYGPPSVPIPPGTTDSNMPAGLFYLVMAEGDRVSIQSDGSWYLGDEHCATFYASTNADGIITIYGWIDPTDWTGQLHMPLNGFIVYKPAPPSEATNPNPGNGATDVSLDAVFSWTAGAYATSHLVYFGTNPTPGAGEFKGEQVGTTYDPGTMSFSTTYYWRIDEKNDYSTTTGTVWSFTTVPPPPGQATNPNPGDKATDMPEDVVLSWTPGAHTVAHDVYLGTDEDDVTDANISNPLGVLVSENQGPNSYDPIIHLELGITYYWRIDERNSNGTTAGEVWSFTRSSGKGMDGFDSYANDDDLRDVWNVSGDGGGGYLLNGVSCEIYLETLITHDGNSMRYVYANANYPYYAEAYADIVDLGIDPNWLGIGAKALSLWFYGQAGNDANEQMYVKLHDADSNTQVVYDGNPNNIKEEEWQEWNIDLEDFNSGGVDLNNVTRITIGFGDGVEPVDSGAGTVYFDDIRLYSTRCVPAKRDANFANVDYAPYGAGDCVVDYKELKEMAVTWLDTVPGPNITPPRFPPVAYWPMDEGDGNKIYTDPCDPLYTGIFSDTGVSWITPGVLDSNAALHFDGNYCALVSCGNQNPASDANELTLAVWVKWLGPRTWDQYLLSKSQGLISKMDGWSTTDTQFKFEVDTSGFTRSFSLRQCYYDVFAPMNILTNYIGKWAHLAATFDGNTAKLYLNGCEVASEPFSLGGGADAALIIGNNFNEESWPDYCPESFYGDLDEVYIYNYALTADEIAYLIWGDGIEPIMPLLIIPPYEPPDLYKDGIINFKDFAILANYWLEEDMFP